MKHIPYYHTDAIGNEIEYIRQSLHENHKIRGDGPFTRRCETWLRDYLSVARVLLTSSCTHALELCALLLDLHAGDEVILPSFTFSSTANAFVLRGATPVFADIRDDTLNLDETLLEGLITPRTRAITVVHYAGVACEMEAINAVAHRYGLTVIEDNAHGLFGKYCGQHLGTLGALATQSFHETKNITCGEGGALIVNDQSYVERAEIVREKGTNRGQFFRGIVDKYTWVDIGSSYLMSDMTAAFLMAQLENSTKIQTRRHEIWRTYQHELSDWARTNGVRLPVIPPHCEHPAHIFHALLPTTADRQRLIQHLKRSGITAVFHYLPLHLSRMGRELGGEPGDCPVTERVSDQLLRLPLYYNLTDGEQYRVIEAMLSFQV